MSFLAPSSFAQNVKEEVALKLVKKFISSTRGETGESGIIWFDSVNSVFTEALTLEAQQTIREVEKRWYGEILEEMRANLLRRFTKSMTQEVVRDGEEAAAVGLKKFYSEMSDAFKSQDDLIRYIEKQKWIEKGILLPEEMVILRGLRVLTEVEELALIASGTRSAKSALRELNSLRQEQLQQEFYRLLNQGGKAMDQAALDRIVLILRNLSEQHQYLYSYAEARFALKLQHRWWYLWTNHWSHSARLKSNWFRLFKRWQTIVKIPNSVPQDPQELSKFFLDFTTLLSQSVHAQPRTFLTLPNRYIQRAIEQRAQVLSAQFDVMKGLGNVGSSPTDDALLLKLEEIFDREGFEGLIPELQKIEGSYNPIPFMKGGRHFKHWIFINIINPGMMVLMYFLDEPESQSQPPFVPKPYLGDLPPQPGEPEYGGQAPPTRPSTEVGDIYAQMLIQGHEREIQRLNDIRTQLSEKLLVMTDPEERASLETEILDTEANIKSHQNDIDQIIKRFAPASPKQE
ncbi:MAG: hypothetical protein A2Z91_00465 [Deltaproteobacteria bacterium GWA2_38_16]|nr:MAG: hypothetical protein A2Z91_00465 [Deltaproteobacteria bacterium GWA2_38_16]